MTTPPDPATIAWCLDAVRAHQEHDDAVREAAAVIRAAADNPESDIAAIAQRLLDTWAAIADPDGVVSTPELLRRCADGRDEYAADAPEDQAQYLRGQASALRCAAAIAEGDRSRALGLLPSWRWTDDLEVPLPGARGLSGPQGVRIVRDGGDHE